MAASRLSSCIALAAVAATASTLSNRSYATRPSGSPLFSLRLRLHQYLSLILHCHLPLLLMERSSRKQSPRSREGLVSTLNRWKGTRKLFVKSTTLLMQSRFLRLCESKSRHACLSWMPRSFIMG